MCALLLFPSPPPPPLQFPQCRFKAYYVQVRRQDPYGTKADKEVQAISLNVGMFMVLAERYRLHGFFFSSHSEVFSPEVVWAHHL